jgi:CheY-like chemotaxis protein
MAWAHRSKREREEVLSMSTRPLRSETEHLALFTDLYELTMLQAYVEQGMDEAATFSLFVRRLPERRNYLLACGLDDDKVFTGVAGRDCCPLARRARLGSLRGRGMAGGRILIVQDDFLAAERLRVVLDQAGYSVVGLAGRTLEALDLAKRHQPQLAIVDMMLEVDVDGFKTAQELIKEHNLKVTTGFPESVVKNEGADRIACAIVRKPYADDDVLGAVAKCLAQA